MFTKLFSWIRSLFTTPIKQQGHEESDRLYNPRERLIYSYFDGKQIVKVDPLVTYKRIMAVAPSLNIDIKVSRSPSKAAPEAHGKMLDHIRGIFGLVPFEQGGLTEIEVVDLFDHFLVFCERQKKTPSTIQTSSTETSQSTPPPTNSGPADFLPTHTSLDSGSTKSEPSTAKPEPSPTVQPSPSAM